MIETTVYGNETVFITSGDLEPTIKNSALSSFFSRLIVETELGSSCGLTLVSDNAKLPKQASRPSRKERRTRRMSNESRPEDSPRFPDKRESRWTSLNSDNPRCAGLTCPIRSACDVMGLPPFPGDRGQGIAMMLPPIMPRKTGGVSSLPPLVPKSTVVLPPIVPTRQLEGGAPMLLPLPRKGSAGMPPYKRLSIRKPNADLKGRKITV
jgi:hypothetical protein